MKIDFFEKPIPCTPTMWTIATSAEEFYYIQRHMNVDMGYQDQWRVGINRVEAMTHYFDHLIIVCFEPDAQADIVVHESVHVFERMMQDMGEVNPGEEVRAYCTQYIFRAMWAALNKRRQPKEVSHEAK